MSARLGWSLFVQHTQFIRSRIKAQRLSACLRRFLCCSIVVVCVAPRFAPIVHCFFLRFGTPPPKLLRLDRAMVLRKFCVKFSQGPQVPFKGPDKQNKKVDDCARASEIAGQARCTGILDLRLFAPGNRPPKSHTLAGMIWGQVSVLLGLACFGAFVLLMMYRKPLA